MTPAPPWSETPSLRETLAGFLREHSGDLRALFHERLRQEGKLGLFQGLSPDAAQAGSEQGAPPSGELTIPGLEAGASPPNEGDGQAPPFDGNCIADQHGLETLLRLLADNALDPRNRRFLAFASRYAAEQYQRGIPLQDMMELAGCLRALVNPLLQEHMSHDPALAERMSEVIETQTADLESALADTYRAGRDRQWQTSESKYFWLFENASEAILSFRPSEGKIIEANAQAERLLGRDRAELLGMPVVEVFARENQPGVEWLVSRPPGHAAVRLDDLSVNRPAPRDGTPERPTTPVSISCNWLQVEGESIAQVLLRDVTGLRQAHRELQSHAEELETRVRDRTAELQASEERFRGLFLQEQRRARHLSLINEAQKCALASRDIETFLPQVTRAIQSHFSDCDVSCYLSESGRYGVSLLWPDTGENAGGGEMVLVASAGGGELSPPLGSRHSLADLTSDSSVSLLFHPAAKSSLWVPITIENETCGLMAVQSLLPDLLDARDVAALQTAAAIVAAHLQSSRLFRNMRELNEFNQNLLNSMLHSLFVVDSRGRVQFVNDRLCQLFGLERESLLKQDVSGIFGEAALSHHAIREAILEVMRSGEGKEIPEVHTRTNEITSIFDLRLFRVYFRGEAETAVLLINLTQRWRNTYQLQLMHEIGRLFQQSLDIDRVLSTVLTCITAGSALGFNRAFVFLFDEARQEFHGAMALGPSSQDEASRIWGEISQRELSLTEILEQVEARKSDSPTPLQTRVRDLRLEASNPCFPAVRRAIGEKRALSARREELLDSNNPGATEAERAECLLAAELFTAAEVAIAPLLAKERVVGVVLADNMYSGAPIDQDDIQLLDTLAQQAGLTIDNALTYQALQKAQKELVSAERLVAVGEMAARVSHEIRNPLATVGGFARSVLKRPEDVEAVKRKIGVVVSEVSRLEELLTDLLDMARPRPMDMQPNSINELVDHAVLLADADIRATGSVVEKYLAPDLPRVMCDRGRLLQALLNTIRNGAQAMPDGGTLKVSTYVVRKTPESPGSVDIEIADTGTGISERALKQVFDPFFSTKVSGSGLGLAVTKRIIQDLGGQIDVESKEGEGTTFIFSLPLKDRPQS